MPVSTRINLVSECQFFNALTLQGSFLLEQSQASKELSAKQRRAGRRRERRRCCWWFQPILQTVWSTAKINSIKQLHYEHIMAQYIGYPQLYPKQTTCWVARICNVDVDLDLLESTCFCCIFPIGNPLEMAHLQGIIFIF